MPPNPPPVRNLTPNQSIPATKLYYTRIMCGYEKDAMPGYS